VFTGIVQGLRPIQRVNEVDGLRHLVVDLGELARGLVPGASVAINGVCLTVSRIDGADATFDVIGETLSRTTLGSLCVGGRVNVERSMTLADEIGGHRVSGHVYDTARVAAIDSGPNARTPWFEVAPRWMAYLYYKGFIAVDGASLTIADIDADRSRFSVSLIPETIARTTLGTIRVDDRVNFEIDTQTQAIVDTVERLLTAPEWRARLKALLAD
jgi:riboflavin synthase